MVAPPFVLDCTLSQTGPAWLSLSCCKGVTYLPTVMLAKQRPTARLGDVVARLRCNGAVRFGESP